jgi:hypothetical protein
MLYVQFDCGVTEKHEVYDEDWEQHGSNIVWLLYDANEIYFIKRIFYASEYEENQTAYKPIAPDRGMSLEDGLELNQTKLSPL